jgi:hypothetical protein
MKLPFFSPDGREGGESVDAPMTTGQVLPAAATDRPADERRDEARNEVKADDKDSKSYLPDFGNAVAAKAYGKQPELVSRLIGKVA